MLRAHLGADELTGRGGADRFLYVYTEDSKPSAPDRIHDFNRSQGDRIDLSLMDANEQATGNQAFTFIGQAKFSAPGQLHYERVNGETLVEANTTGKDGAEVRIALDGLHTPLASDFLR